MRAFNHKSGPRRGFTLLEMMLSMVIFLSVMGAAASVFKMSSRTIASQSGRIEAQHNARFALTLIERELRMGGIGLAVGQPSIVHAGPMGVTFNTNLVSRDSASDRTAVYFNPEADVRTVGMFPPGKALALPGTTDLYPDTAYYLSDNNVGTAETISYWLSKDSTSSRSDEYVLFRRANYAPPIVVTRGVIVGPKDTVFQFFAADTSGKLSPIALTRLPATHAAKMHKSSADTGALALVDSIRAVKVRFKTLYKDPRGIDAIREFAGRVTILNAGAVGRATCGERPLGVKPSAVLATDAEGNPYVRVTFARSIDEETGEKDVDRYTIYRRASSATEFGEALASIPAGEISYTYDDYSGDSGEEYVYGVVAQDCTPAMSHMEMTTAVLMPGVKVETPAVPSVEPITQ